MTSVYAIRFNDEVNYGTYHPQGTDLNGAKLYRKLGTAKSVATQFLKNYKVTYKNIVKIDLTIDPNFNV